MNKIHKAARNRCKIKMAIQGASGSGKTYSALLLAYGLTNSWSKIVVIDTENGSANLYADLGDYSVLNLSAPYTPEAYSEAIDLAAQSGFECIVIDSLSHEWQGQGGILDIHSNIPGNSFTAWAKVTPRHNAFVQKILQTDIHIISTMRSKTEYVLSEKNGKQVPEKLGLKSVQREDTEYEFTIVFELNQKHQASVSKDRTGLFKNKPELHLTSEVGKTIAEWCNSAAAQIKPEIKVQEKEAQQDDFVTRINQCETMEDLKNLFNSNPAQQQQHRDNFISRRNQLNININTFSKNGVHH
jgi:hypothetical protein